MATLTIRNIDDTIKQKLRQRAAERGVSMEQEVRDTLAESVRGPRRRRSILEELKKLGARPDTGFDLKKASDEMWGEESR